MTGTYTTKEVARLLKLSEQRVRDLVRAGVVDGGRAASAEGSTQTLQFSFQELLILKTAMQLAADGMPLAKIKRALSKLRRQGAPRPVTGLKIFAQGGRIVADDGGQRWEPESGQQFLPFSDKSQTGSGTPPAILSGPGHPPLHDSNAPSIADLPAMGDANLGDTLHEDIEAAEPWFETALALEEDEPDKAYAAYLRALACNPEHTEATINIGRLCAASGELQRAAAYFRQAIRLEPSHPVAHYNLAVTLHDLGLLEQAEQAYRLSLQHDGHFADAHFNLAALLEQKGDRHGALRHLQAYHSICGEDTESH